MGQARAASASSVTATAPERSSARNNTVGRLGEKWCCRQGACWRGGGLVACGFSIQPGSHDPGRGPARRLWLTRYVPRREKKRTASASAARPKPATIFTTSLLMVEVPWIAAATGTHGIVFATFRSNGRLICRSSKAPQTNWAADFCCGV